jgi:hypothetical protein
VSIEQLRATLRQESIRSKSSQRLNWMAVQNTMVQTIVVTSKHEDCNLMFTNHGKEDGIPSKQDSKAQNKDQRSIVTACTNTYKGLTFSTH